VLAHGRRAEIVDVVRAQGSASVAELAARCGVSAVTIHRDLERLAEQGLVLRVRGGARAPDDAGTSAARSDWFSRLGRARDQKAAIAAVARPLVEDGSTIFIDASTSGLALARRLEEDPPEALTLVTNSPAIVYELRSEAIHVIAAPGEVDQNLRAVNGRWTVEFLRELQFSVAFISAAGVSPAAGLTTSQRILSDTLRSAHAAAARSVGLVDSSKWGRSALLPIAPLDEFAAIVVDDGLTEEEAEAYREAGARLVIARPVEAGRARPAVARSGRE